MKISFPLMSILLSAKQLKKLNAVIKIIHYMKKNQKGILLSSFIISYFSHRLLIWMFCSKKSTKKINTVHERSLRIILKDREPPHPLLLEGAHQITFHQRYISSLMIKVYGHSPDIMNDIFKLRENMYKNLRNFRIFKTENPRSLKN